MLMSSKFLTPCVLTFRKRPPPVRDHLLDILFGWSLTGDLTLIISNTNRKGFSSNLDPTVIRPKDGKQQLLL